MLAALDQQIFKIVKHFPQWLKPNHLTMLRLIFLVPIIWFLLEEKLIWFLLFFILGYLTDVLDGPLARLRQQKTTLGTFLDPIADKLLFFVSLFLLAHGRIDYFLFYILLIAEVALMLLSLIYVPVLKYLKIKFKFSSNIFGKLKMVAQVTAIILIVFNLISVSEILLWLSLCFTLGNLLYSVFNRN